MVVGSFHFFTDIFQQPVPLKEAVIGRSYWIRRTLILIV